MRSGRRSSARDYGGVSRRISRLALGNVTTPTQTVYRVAEDATQNYHVDGLPFGTRGGLQVRHLFPAAGEYALRVVPVNMGNMGNTRPFGEVRGEQLEIGWVEGVTYEWSPEDTLDTVRSLIEVGADVNAVDDDGRTALHGAAHKGRNDVVRVLVDHGADLAARDYGSRDSIHALAGVTWQAIDYADGLVRIGVQSSIAHPETAALLRELMDEAGLAGPARGPHAGFHLRDGGLPVGCLPR